MKKTIIITIIILSAILIIYFFYSQNNNIENLYKNSLNRLINDINSKGIFNYSYSPKKNIYENTNNEIRQFLASRILAKLSNNNVELKNKLKKNLDFIFENRYHEKGNNGYIELYGKSKIGANSLIIRVLIYSPFFNEYKDKINNLINGIYSLQESNGKLKPWFIEPKYKYDEDYLMYFYSGETILTFLELYEKTGNIEYYNFAKKSEDYYFNDYITNIYSTYYPAYVPWHTFSMSKFYNITKDKKYADAIFLMNDKLLEQQDNNINSKTFGRFFKKGFEKYGSPHSSSDSIYTESIIYAYEIANKLGDNIRKEKYLKSINNSLINLSKLQYSTINTNYNGKSIKYLGGIKSNIDNSVIRVDNVAHFLDMLYKYNDIFKAFKE